MALVSPYTLHICEFDDRREMKENSKSGEIQLLWTVDQKQHKIITSGRKTFNYFSMKTCNVLTNYKPSSKTIALAENKAKQLLKSNGYFCTYNAFNDFFFKCYLLIILVPTSPGSS